MSLGEFKRSSADGLYKGPANHVKVSKVAVRGDRLIVPTQSFSGKITLFSGYKDDALEGKPLLGSLTFNYGAEPIDFKFFANASPLVSYNPSQEVAPDKVEKDVFVARGWKTNPGDDPSTPARRFWSGSASYGAYPTIHNSNSSPVFSPQIYKWSNEGKGALLPAPEGASDFDRNELELVPSNPFKKLTHDFGEFDGESFLSTAREFPKTTTVRAIVKDGSGNSDAELEGVGTINWHVPWANIHEVTLRFEVTLAPGEELDDEMRAALAAGDEALIEELRRIKGAEIFRKNGPKMWADATKAVAEEVITIVVEEVVTRGAGRVLRGIRVREVARTLSNRARPGLKNIVSNFRSTREAAGKQAGSWKSTVTVKKKGTVGKRNPQKQSANEDDFDFDLPDAEPTEQEVETAEGQEPTPEEERVDQEPDDEQAEEEEDLDKEYLYHYSPVANLHQTGLIPAQHMTDLDAKYFVSVGVDPWPYLRETGVAYSFKYQYKIDVTDLGVINLATMNSGFSDYICPPAVSPIRISPPFTLPDDPNPGH